MYHRIADEPFDPWGLAVSPANFAAQLEWLARKRTVLPLIEFAEHHRSRTLPADAVALTFDDGYSCIAEVAAPFLKAADLPATVFIPAALIERQQPFWWDELRALVLGHSGDVLSVRGEHVGLGKRDPNDAVWVPGAPPRGARQKAYHHIWATLREMSPGDLEHAMTELRRQSSPKGAFGGPRPMSPAQVRAAASGRIEFGSHALTHPWLSSLTAAEKKAEIGESVIRCERLAGSRPRAFAYPYGNFDEQSKRLVEAAGFTCACATMGSAVASRARAFALPRVQVPNQGVEVLRRTLALA